jgi:hemin uptake protein HemP
VQPSRPKPPVAPATTSASAPNTVTSRELFGGRRELRIVHRGEQYTLRITRLGKLILTK